jgi:hypothetical protein
LAKDAVSAEHGDTLGSAPLVMVGFLGAHSVGDKVGPFALPEGFETMWTADFSTDDFGHAAVVAKAKRTTEVGSEDQKFSNRPSCAF